MVSCWAQATPKVDLSKDKAKALMERIQNAGTEVVNAKVSNTLLPASVCVLILPEQSVSG